jgi:hypothetical protein
VGGGWVCGARGGGGPDGGGTAKVGGLLGEIVHRNKQGTGDSP